MKRNFITFFAIGIFLITGCEKFPVGNAFLEKAPGVDVTVDTIFKNLEYAQRYLWTGYRTLRYGVNTQDAGGKNNLLRRDFLEAITDLCQSYLMDGGAVKDYYNGGLTSNDNDMSKYNMLAEGAWDGIRIAYNFIENIDRVPDVDPDYVKQLKAEALMIIACQYSDLYRHIGGMPWVDHAMKVNEPYGIVKRMTAQATCDSIVALCDRAAQDLPWTIANPEEWDGRFTKAAALGAKARILLFNASPLYNSDQPFLDGTASNEFVTWHGSYDVNRWKQAMDASAELISLAESTGEYKLYHKAGNSYRKDFQEAYFLRGNGEVLISVRDRFRGPTSASTNYYFYASVTWGCGLTTQELVDFFPMTNGLPISAPGSGYNPTNPYVNRDPRLYETVVVNGDTYKGRTAECWIGGRERSSASSVSARTGYRMRKFILDSDLATSWGAIIHWPYLRLAEIYLSYAEAANEYYGAPTAEAYRCVNLVRSRVGLPGLPAGMTREEFREALLAERVCEFAFEEVRWFDLVRWKKEDVFKKRLHGMDITRVSTSPLTFSYNIWEIPERYWAKSFSPKWYLSPVPQTEVDKGYGLIQNPGWE